MRRCGRRRFNFHVRQMKAFMPLWLRHSASEVISGELLSEIEEHESDRGHEIFYLVPNVAVMTGKGEKHAEAVLICG